MSQKHRRMLTQFPNMTPHRQRAQVRICLGNDHLGYRHAVVRLKKFNTREPVNKRLVSETGGFHRSTYQALENLLDPKLLSLRQSLEMVGGKFEC